MSARKLTEEKGMSGNGMTIGPVSSSVLAFDIHYDFDANCWVARCLVTGVYGQGNCPTRAVQGCISAMRLKLKVHEERPRP